MIPFRGRNRIRSPREEACTDEEAWNPGENKRLFLLVFGLHNRQFYFIDLQNGGAEQKGQDP